MSRSSTCGTPFMTKTVVIGGGAAGFFAAIKALEQGPVVILEKSQRVLSKVKISGGGRCNVTHHCFDPKELITHYPRGAKELLGPFHRFGPQDTVDWFSKRGVELKTEKDGRMFPVTDSSETIIKTLMEGAQRAELIRGAHVTGIGPDLTVYLRKGESIKADRIILATGGTREGHRIAASLGHTVVEPVPSLFTFNVPTSPLLDLSGISVPNATVCLPEFKLAYSGPLLITHWGFSGPAILKLSAFGSRHLHACGYNTTLEIDWGEEPLPKRLRKALSDHDIHRDCYQIEGKTTYKAEFVTSGGIKLSEVNFKTMESKRVPGLHFAGEILDIDGITGGFNFQAAWTTASIAAS